jgi:hypothetical protein
MAYTARNLEYFHTTLNTSADEAFEVFDNFASLGVNFVALTMVPIAPDSTQLTLFPEDAAILAAVAKQTGLVISGPHRAILVQGEDKVGALAGIHKRLHEEHVQIYASNAVTDGSGRFGCIVYLRPQDADRALRALSKF